MLFPLAPVTTALLVTAGWERLGGVAVNVPVALATGTAGLGLWVWLIVVAARVRP
jgi:hypothetical protein